jgi:lipid A ethanolaminephosphotransferase
VLQRAGLAVLWLDNQSGCKGVVQKREPWITWMSGRFEQAHGLEASYLNGQRERALSHDYYFHSVLGLMDVQTQAYSPTLDAYAACRDGQTPVDATGPAQL